MLKITKTFFALFFIFIFCPFINAQSFWTGNYEFNEDGGKTVGGTTIFVTHQLEIRQTDDGLLATIQSNGYQTSIDLVGTVKTEGDKLMIYFDSYGENNIFENYEQGDLLLSLEKKTTKGKTELLTFWNKFQPVVPKNEKSGKVYFKRVAESKE
ncbi:hypothetical protein BH20ACI4_BH20ACI4_25250 [soil metagenome]